jgi:hypothetical protein
MILYLTLNIFGLGYYAISAYIIISLITVFYNWKLKKGSFTGISYAQCFNPFKWMSVLLGYILKLIVPLHILEQYILRHYDEDCIKECYNSDSGKCETCGCDARAKAWAPTEKDSRHRWGPIIFNKKEYQTLRENSPITIKIIYKNESELSKS